MTVNNEIYDRLGERWYRADDDPIALLRAESRLRNPWITERIQSHCGRRARVLDVGCGAGFLGNHLAAEGARVTGLDTSAESLHVARKHDATRAVRYVQGDALSLPFAAASFDAVCAMDFLEHVEDPARAVREAARVLRSGGVFFLHTFNRNVLAWFVAIKSVEWFVSNTPERLHELRLFIKPAELREMCLQAGLVIQELRGSEPVVSSRAFVRLLLTGRVPAEFRFQFTRSTRLAYTGYALKASNCHLDVTGSTARPGISSGQNTGRPASGARPTGDIPRVDEDGQR